MTDRWKSFYDRANAFVHRDVWDVRLIRMTRLQAAGVRTLRIGLIALRGFRKSRCRLHASALTFVTLLSVVPVLAMMFAIARGFSAEEDLILRIKDLIQPMAGEPAVEEWLNGVTEQVIGVAREANISTLGAVGIALFLYGIIKMLGTIEGSFNEIWGVTRSRAFLRKVADYLSVLLVLSVLFGAPALATGSLASNVVVRWLEDHRLTALRLVVFLAPWLGFTLLNKFIPNTKVHWRASFVGGILGGILWDLSIVVFLGLGIGVASKNAIYGTLASVPFVLIWVQMNWLIVLLSAQLTYAFQNERAYVREGAWVEATHAGREAMALALMAPIAQHFSAGKDPWTADALAEHLDAPLKLVNETLNVLSEEAILIPISSGESASFVPARSIDTIPVAEIIDAVGGYGTEQSIVAASSRVLAVQERLRKAVHDAVKELTAADLAKLAEADEPASDGSETTDERR